MNYYEIGERIRRFRKARGLTQNELAEQLGISTIHLSHIETGSTKLSLSVFVKISEVLKIQTDELLHDTPEVNTTTLRNELISLLESCDTTELKIILETTKALKTALKTYN